MIPKEILKKIRRIQITTSRMVTESFAGKYQSVFKGKGIEFYEVREYVPGDEIRTIDWNVTARCGHPFVKKFVEERELTVMLLLDISASTHFGTTGQLKSQLAAEICSVLAFSAIKNNDKVGLIVFSDRIEKFIPARKGLRHILRVIREAIYFKPQGQKTDIAIALDYLNRVTKGRTISFLFSDFFAKGFKKTLAVANKRHDLVAVTINDPREFYFPDLGMVKLRDSETGKDILVDSSNKDFRRQYKLDALKRLKERQMLFRSVGVDSIDVYTDRPYDKELFKFFKTRERRQH
ncbi:MAG: DUF58 domain-containing protein [Candidatus Omnitrophica bacterium]|nr:DUF58 domain-containing protein [Candidatus Omnitrophota bacterium]